MELKVEVHIVLLLLNYATLGDHVELLCILLRIETGLEAQEAQEDWSAPKMSHRDGGGDDGDFPYILKNVFGPYSHRLPIVF